MSKLPDFLIIDLKNLYMKEEHVKKTEKSLHEESIWKPISELPESTRNMDILIKIRGEVSNAQAYTPEIICFINIGEKEFEEIECISIIEEYCTLTDFINQQESLEQRITDLEKRLIT